MTTTEPYSNNWASLLVANFMFDHLFSTLALGTRTAKNRVMQLATFSGLQDGGRLGPRYIAFYEERARAGVGTIVTSSLAVDPSIGDLRLSVADPASIPDFRKLATALHAHDTLLIGQLKPRRPAASSGSNQGGSRPKPDRMPAQRRRAARARVGRN